MPKQICAMILLAFALAARPAIAQELRIATVERPPFAMKGDGGEVTGFSIDLWKALAADMGMNSQIEMAPSFPEMLRRVESGEVDGAVANISITLDREKRMDFSQPIFASGLQIMIPEAGGGPSPILQALLSREILIALLLALALLFGGGMLMWVFERKQQEYFRKPAGKALFPAFWWALNLVVNGGFEERVPQSRPGRIFAVLLVISSLFIVSLFVAKITATITVDAIQSNVSSLSDLYGKRVATISESTASAFLDTRNIRYRGYESLDPMIADFEAGRLDAVVFDAPILAYYANTRGRGKARMAGAVFRPENYGIALPQGSRLAVQINRSLLNLRENGTHEEIYRKWFGSTGE